MVYATLFAAAFVSATVLPGFSEAGVAALVVAGHPPAVVVAVATAGNVLGAVVNWWLGRFLIRFRDRRWFPVKPDQLERAQRWYRRYGVWSLLLAWVPVIGDPLTFVAGILRVRLWQFLVLVTLGKAGRYAVLAAASSAAAGA